MTDDLDGFDSDHEINDGAHSNLISAVTQLEGKHRVKASVRKEPSTEVSEFHLVKSGTGKRDVVHLGELAASLGNQASHSLIRDKIKETIKKSNTIRTLKKPLEKIEVARIDRTVRYRNVQKELGRWNAVVESNRVSETLSFPLNHETVTIKDGADLVKNFKPETDLEVAMSKALNVEVVVMEDPAKEESQFPMTLAELVQRRRELARLRAQQSYREVKEYRHSKIKSKKYHRILRKEKMKQHLKDFEILKETNPELALRQLEDLDRNRAEERASLRHRTTGKWAKGKAIRAKYDVESRKVLAQQLAISKELTQKSRKEESSDEDVPVKEVQPVAEDNPWVGPTGPILASDLAHFYRSYREYKKKKTAEKTQPAVNEEAELPPKTVDLEKESQLTTSTAEKEVVKEIDLESRGETLKEITQIVPSVQESSVDIVEDCTQVSVAVNGKRKRKEVEVREAKRKRKKTETVVAASGTWSVVSESSANGVSSPDCRPSIDSLFDNIEDAFKKRVDSRLSRLKARLNLDNEDNDGKSGERKEMEENGDEGLSLALKKPSQRGTVNEPLSEGLTLQPSEDQPNRTSNLPPRAPDVPVDIDPAKFLHIEPKHLQTRLPDEIGAGDHALDDDNEDERQAAITEAFADDDVVAEFTKELQDASQGEVVKPEPKVMPGWGSWATDNTEAIKRQRLKKLRKRGLKPKDRRRPCAAFGVPIIYDKPTKALREHLVRDLPFPFTSVAAYEASIRAPLGRTWVTEVAHRRLTAPKVVTKLGTVIKPMDETSLVKTDTLPLPARKPFGKTTGKEPPAKRQRV